MKLPRSHSQRSGSLVPPRSAPILRYGVAVLSTLLALIPGFLLSDLVESRLVVFAVAVMVSAWYGGWKPGLVATAFAVTVNAYFALNGVRTEADYRKAVVHLTLFIFVALLICSFNAALRSAQEGLARSEANFRSLVTNSPYGICRCDLDGTVVEANPAFVHMLGFESTSDVIGRNLGSLHRDSEQWLHLTENFNTQQDFTGSTSDFARKDGTVASIRLSGRAIRDRDRKSTTFEIFAEDITERRALEQQLRQAQKMEAIGRLAGGIAHDFNNLLMVITGYSEFLLEKVVDSSLRTPAQEIASAAQRATSLTRQLLAFSRKQMLAPKILDLNGVVTENLRMLTRLIGEDIDLVMTPAADLGPVRADPSQMEQVIMNLAVNARDAMPSGGKLTIETSNVTVDESYARVQAGMAPGEYVMLSISDTGSGMDTETQAQIFEPFFTTKGVKGTGLGLSTVYGIVKQSGGYIFVSSDPGRGTAFRIYLPRIVEVGELAITRPAASVFAPKPAIETVLIVEDETNLRRMACQYLEKQGYHILEAADGAAAMQVCVAHQGPIDLLLTDVIMPGMNGHEVAQRVRSIRPETKILYMSGYTENVIGHNGTLDPGINLLQKPFTLQALKEKVREVLDAEPLPQEAAMSPRSAATVAPYVNRIPAFRAQRFKLNLPVRYRLLGEESWREGTTENISRSGLLFRVDQLLEPTTQVEISLVLPPEIAGLSAAEVVCRGEVVRTMQPESASGNPALAAKILQYHFQHGAQIPQA